ncbi:hypothetical protein LRU46_004558 [Salmonella enterica]|nr:hypothetical protein [Salmonella enterica]EIP1620387.1 hypothetical protein [Salmonella enterica]
MSASEQKRPVLSISGKRNPSGLYRKPETGGLVDGKDVQGQEAAGESDAVSADVPDSVDSVTSTSAKRKPVYKGPPSFDEALRRHPVSFIRGIPLTGLTGVPKNLSAYYGNQGKAGKNNVRKSKKESSKESEKAGREK